MDPDLGPLGPNSGRHDFFIKLVVRHCSKLSSMQFKGKLINQTWENGKKPNFESDFAPFGPNSSPKDFFRKFYLY